MDGGATSSHCVAVQPAYFQSPRTSSCGVSVGLGVPVVVGPLCGAGEPPVWGQPP